MKKKKAPSIDMTSHGPIKDISPDGDRDCSDNLSDVLYELHTRRVLPKKSRRIKVSVSDIIRWKRVEKIQTYSFAYLCREYASIEKKQFEPESHKEKERWKLESLRKQGEKEMAWAIVNQSRHLRKLIEQNRIVQSLPEDQREAKQKEFEEQNGPTVLRIG